MIRALALALLLSGCAAFEPLGRKDLTIGCQMADAGTTLLALSRGGVYETNPAMAAALSTLGPAGLLIAKAAIAYMLVTYANEPKVLGPANVATCGFAASNAIHFLR